jgi:gamma-glutamylcyclotransferase (GGCT)/AIG2-like uncharacterized protein YtfP
MGNNISIISVMFEEIKGMLASIEKKLNERVSVKENHSSQGTVTEPKSNVQTDTVKQEQLLRLIATYMQNSEQKIGKVSDAVLQYEKHVLSQMDELKQITVRQKPDSKVLHYHRIEWKSSKVVITFVCLSVLLLSSFIGNIHQFEVNSRMTDNDLKYRYIKSTNGTNPTNLNMIEDIFYYQRDKNKIREIRQKVEEYERKLIENAKEIERNRIQNEQNKR